MVETRRTIETVLRSLDTMKFDGEIQMEHHPPMIAVTQGRLMVNVPSTMRLLKSGLIRARRAKDSSFGPDQVCVLEISPEDASRHGVHLSRTTLGEIPDLQNVVRRTGIRCGRSPVRAGGWEGVIQLRVRGSEAMSFDWEMVFPVEDTWVLLRIFARGDFAQEEPYWSDTVRSVRLSKGA